MAGNFALEPVECLVLTGQDFLDFLDAHPRVPVVLLRALSADCAPPTSAGSTPAHARRSSVSPRLLVELADKHGRLEPAGVDIEIPLTQHELASLIGASRESVVRALTSLRSRGLVTTGRRRITVRDVHRLRRHAEQSGRARKACQQPKVTDC